MKNFQSVCERSFVCNLFVVVIILGNYAEALELLRQANVSCPPSEMIARSNMIEWGDFDAHNCEEIKDSFPYDDL